MAVMEFLDKIPLLGVFLASLVITILSTELGYMAGRSSRRRSTEKDGLIHPGPFAAATLGLLAFLLAMVYGTVASRLHSLKQVALDEANAIGTVYLRVDLLPRADRAEIRQLLHEYVQLRIEAVEVGTWQATEQAIERSEELQGVLWSRASAVAEEQATPISALIVDSVNQMIDSGTARIAFGIHYRVPGTLWLVLYGLAVVAMAMGGYASGYAGHRRSIALALAAAAAYSVVLLLVIGLDRPLEAHSFTQSVMLDLQESMTSPADVQP